MSVKTGSVRLEASKILYRVYETESYADILLEDLLRNRSFTSQDRALLGELIFGVLRWRGRLDYIIRNKYHGAWEQLPVKIKIILELGLYQLIYLDRIPAFAAINEAVKISKTWASVKWSGTVNAILRSFSRNPEDIAWPDISVDPALHISIAWSHPEWLIQRWIRDFGIERTLAICEANNQKPELSVRVNRQKADPELIREKLSVLGFHVKPGRFLQEFLTISNGQGLFDTDLFREGWITIQDESAGLVARLMNPEAGEVIVDLAAAPGGKTGHMAELSNSKCILLAVDRHFGRLMRLQETMLRLGHHTYIVQADSQHLPFLGIDKILIDAPCSGIGVLKKRAELRWRIRPEKIAALNEIQKKLLSQAARSAKQNGVIIYSTCTTIFEENKGIIDWFLKEYPQFIIEPASQWVPQEVTTRQGWIETWLDLHGIDGSFAVRLKHRSN